MRFRLQKYPLVLQYDQLDCGPAAMLSVLRFYGGDTSLVHMRTLCRTDVHGTTMQDMLRAGQAIGFVAQGATGSFLELTRAPLPCIAHVVLASGLHHYLVIYKIVADRLYVGDPGKGKYYLSRSQFEAVWTQRAVLLLTPNGRLTQEKKRSWIKWIWDYLRRQESWLLQILFTGLLYASLGLTTTVVVQVLVDQLIPTKNLHNLTLLISLLFLLLGVRVLIGYLRDRFLIVANKRLSQSVTDDFIDHLFHLDKSFFDNRKTGDITARIDDSLQIHRTSLFVMQSVVLDLLMVIGALALMFYFSVTMGWITVCLAPFYTGLLWCKYRPIKDQQHNVMKSHSLFDSMYINSIQRISEIKNFSTASAYVGMNQTVFGHFQDQIAQLGVLRIGLTASVSALGSLISTIQLFVGAVLVIRGDLLLGQFIAAYSLLSYLLPSIHTLLAGYVEFQGAHMAAQRMMDLLLIDREKNGGKVTMDRLHRLHIDQVSFAYAKAPMLLRSVSLCIPAGRVTSLWGPSGAGKSTLVQLIQRKYLPLTGTITFDEIPAQQLELSHLRSIVGVVPQQIGLFNATLAENILVGRPATGLEEIQQRLDAIGLADLSRRFKPGLLTLLGEEGYKLSGGEIQLLGMARALYGRPLVLIIDEGFTAIDAELELCLSQAVQRFAQEHAVLLITHNVDSLRKTDYVYLLREGRIVEEGEPDHLLCLDGFFYRLVEAKHMIQLSTGASV